MLGIAAANAGPSYAHFSSEISSKPDTENSEQYWEGKLSGETVRDKRDDRVNSQCRSRCSEDERANQQAANRVHGSTVLRFKAGSYRLPVKGRSYGHLLNDSTGNAR
jgi:hypothetical protein